MLKHHLPGGVQCLGRSEFGRMGGVTQPPQQQREQNPWAVWRWPYAIWVMLLLPCAFYFCIHLKSRWQWFVEWVGG